MADEHDPMDIIGCEMVDVEAVMYMIQIYIFFFFNLPRIREMNT